MTAVSRVVRLMLAALALWPASAYAQTHASPDSAAVVDVINRFHAALAAADSAGALGLLTEDAIIVEAGGLETLEQYRAHHLPADIEFARAITSERTVRQARIVGDAAWVTATSVTRGTFRERAIDSEGAELMVLRRTAQGWRIAAIHWSSHARRRN